MADAAEFFANKKKKKKAFKFNANLVSPSSVAPTVHIDAPALSNTSQDAGISQLADAVSSVNIVTANAEESTRGSEAKPSGGEEWDDEAMAATLARKGPVVAAGSSAAVEVLDMKSLEKQRGIDPDDIAEKLRVEETKAKLAAAREGMEREAAKLKEEKEKKEREKEEATTSGSRFGSASKSLSSGTSKWVPPQLRAGTAASLSRSRVGGTSQKLDVENEELFPDLATAEKILEQKEQQKPTFKAPKKTSIGGGASWASKTSSTTATAESATEKEETIPTAPQEQKEQDAEPPQETKVEETTTSSAPRRVPTKTTGRKKKDVSTFKPSGK